MNIEFYRPLWGKNKAIDEFVDETSLAGFTGLEGYLPDSPKEYQAFCHEIKSSGLKYIGEISTGGMQSDLFWVPKRSATVEDHLNDFENELQRLRDADLDVTFTNCMGGLDAWPTSKAVHFYEQAMLIAERYEISVTFETHRTRCLYSPWTSLDIVTELPEISITADLSHWCVVAERLIGDEEGLDAIIPVAHHIHGRVGYDQGPQVPNPAAPEYEEFVKAHQQWWQRIWAAQYQRGYTTTTMMTEYGIDGYLHRAPFTQEPVADLWEIMQWVKTTESENFEQFKTLNNIS